MRQKFDLIFKHKGQGLGKNKEGHVEPIKVDIKINRKGLVSQDDNKNRESDILKQCGLDQKSKLFFV